MTVWPRAVRLRALTMVDSYTRECLAIDVDSSVSSRRVSRVPEWIIRQRGAPEPLRCENGPEFTSRHFLSWCEERKLRVTHIQRGKPREASIQCSVAWNQGSMGS